MAEQNENEPRDERFKDDIVEFIGKDYTREVPYSILRLSQLVKDAVMGDADDDDNDDGDENTGSQKHSIHLSDNNVTSEVLDKVIEYCTYYLETEPMKEIPSPFPQKEDIELEDLVQDWYAKFGKSMKRDVLFQLLISANYLHIQPLLNLSCLAVAKTIHKKSEDEMRAIFNIKKPVPPENKASEEVKE